MVWHESAPAILAISNVIADIYDAVAVCRAAVGRGRLALRAVGLVVVARWRRESLYYYLAALVVVGCFVACFVACFVGCFVAYDIRNARARIYAAVGLRCQGWLRCRSLQQKQTTFQRVNVVVILGGRLSVN